MPTEEVEVQEEVKPELTVEEYVRQEFADIPIMIDVARCESQFRQFDENGNVLQGYVDNRDTGVFQINTYYHQDTATKLGIDFFTLEGNVEYARYLYEHQGTAPWNASSPCWSKLREVALY